MGTHSTYKPLTITTELTFRSGKTYSWGSSYNRVSQREFKEVIEGDHHSPTAYLVWKEKVFPQAFIATYKTGRKRRFGTYSEAETFGLGSKYGAVTNGLPNVSHSTRRQAVMRAYSQLENKRINLGESLAEAKRTGQMVASKIGKVAQAYAFARRGKWKYAARALGVPFKKNFYKIKGWANKWLALQFGWLPLLSDGYNGVQLLIEKIRNDDDPWEIEAQGTAFQPSPFNKLQSLAFKWKGSFKGSARCVMKYKVEKQHLRGLTSLGLSNPASLAWDLLPYSFVVDWFVKVGAFLSALGASAGAVWSSGQVTLKAKGNLTVTSIWSGYLSTPTWRVDSSAFQRIPLGAPPAAVVTFDFGIDLWRIVTGIALLKK